jgi:hypothetical protein
MIPMTIADHSKEEEDEEKEEKKRNQENESRTKAATGRKR